MAERYIAVLIIEVVEDINEAIDYYDGLLPGLAERFKNEIFIQIEEISSWPFARKVRFDNVRFANLKSFPYALHYYVSEEPLTNVIKIIGVYSHHIDSRKWLTRK